MQIAFTPRRGTPEMDISGIQGGSALARWRAGEVRQIGDDQNVAFQGPDGVVRMARAIDVVFSCGPDFVDAKTGKNPQFTCADCAEHALDDSHLDRLRGVMVPYRVDCDASKPRLCVACYLGRYPQHIVAHRTAGLSEEVIAQAQERARKAQTPKPQPAPAKPDAAPAAEEK